MELCDRCRKSIPDGDIRYILRITVAVDDGGATSRPISDDEVNQIIKQLENADPAELAREVYEDRTFILCVRCKRSFMRNPFGIKWDGQSDEGLKW